MHRRQEPGQATQLLTRVVDMGETTDYLRCCLTELGKVQAEQQQFAAAALSYQKLLESTVTDPVVLATAAYNRGVCWRRMPEMIHRNWLWLRMPWSRVCSDSRSPRNGLCQMTPNCGPPGS